MKPSQHDGIIEKKINEEAFIFQWTYGQAQELISELSLWLQTDVMGMQSFILTTSKCMLPPPVRGIVAMLTRRVDDYGEPYGKKQTNRSSMHIINT